MSFLSEDEFTQRFQKLKDVKISHAHVTSHYVDTYQSNQSFMVRVYHMNNKQEMEELVRKSQIINSLKSPHFLKTYYFGTSENLSVPTSHPSKRASSNNKY
jgi:hypothetical protein